MNQLSAYTWPDGTPRSQGNAFDIPARPATQIRPARVSEAAATQVNKNTHATAWCGMSNSQKAPR